MKKRLLAVILVFSMLLTLITYVPSSAELQMAEIDGKQYYLIYNASDLCAFRDFVNYAEWNDDGTLASAPNRASNAMLMDDIDLTGITWEPMCPRNYRVTGRSYGGIFDGNGKTISNLYINYNSDEAVWIGFFGCIEGGTVKNLSIVNADINSSTRDGNFAGILAGLLRGTTTIENCFIDGKHNINARNNAGGVVYQADYNGCKFTNCATTCGNFFAVPNGSVVTNCFYVSMSDGDESTENSDGTLDYDAKYSECYTGSYHILDGAANVDATLFASGEVTYWMNEKIKALGETETVWYQNVDNGGSVDSFPVASNNGHAQVYQVNKQPCPDSEVVTAYSNVNNDIIVEEHSYVDGKCTYCLTGTEVPGGQTTSTPEPSPTQSVEPSNTPVVAPTLEPTAIVEETVAPTAVPTETASLQTTEIDGKQYYLIYNADDLCAFRDLVNYAEWDENGKLVSAPNISSNAMLMNDIDLSGINWEPIAPFTSDQRNRAYLGTFDGNGYAIKNLYIDYNSSEANWIGFFSSVVGSGTVRNVSILNANIGSSNRFGNPAGILVGIARYGATFENCFADGVHTANNQKTGGFIYQADGDVKFVNCATTCGSFFAIKGGGTATNCFYVLKSDGDSSTNNEDGTTDYDATYGESFVGTYHILDGEAVGDEAFASGTVAYWMNEKASENNGAESIVWYQNIDNGKTVDAFPVADDSHGQVYKISMTCCDSEPVTLYSNTNADIVYDEHLYEEGVCVNCGAEKSVVEYVTVEYKDINNNTAKKSDVVKGEAIGTLPTMFRDGYVFEGWSLNGEKIDETLIVDGAISLKPLFKKEITSVSTYTIVLGENAEYSKINGFEYVSGMETELTLADKVVLKMKATEGKEVDYWTINGQVVSTAQTLNFMVQPGEMKVGVVLKDVGTENTKTVDPNVLITSTVSRPDHNNRFYVYSMRVIDEPSKVIECGVAIMRGTNATDTPEFTLESDGVYTIKSSRQGSMGEYAIVRKDTETQYSVRSYMKYKDASGNDQIVYSDAVTVLLDVQ